MTQDQTRHGPDKFFLAVHKVTEKKFGCVWLCFAVFSVKCEPDLNQALVRLSTVWFDH